jgi:2-polyprenyl-6-methoxyphenol hydroxylase-like FAD-dependent oxidoreductase
MDTTDVLVVGAGPVGLTAACQLARLGVTVDVIDKLDRPTTESRAVTVHARSMEMLAPLGALPRMLDRGRRVDGLAMVDGATGRTRARVDFGEVPSRYPFLLDIAQPDSEAVLAERAGELGVVVERGVELAALTQDDDGVDVTLRSRDGERTARVGWVVGADGGHSPTRHLVGTSLEGDFHGQTFAMADVEVDTDLSRDTIRMYTHGDGMGIFFPLLGTRARIMFFVDPPGPDAGDPTLEQIQALADTRMGGRLRVHDPRWLTYFEIHHAQVPQYRHGRVLLAGDAAHIHSPAGAQGMNTGIQDAANLGWKLALVAQGRASAELLDTYHDERHPVGADVVRTTTVLTGVGTASGASAGIRDAALFLVGHARRLGDALAAKTAEVTISYRDSALSVQHGGHRGAVRAGDHAPDPDGLRRPDGDPVTVEELLATPGLLLLARTDHADTVDALRRVLGDLGRVVQVVPAADPSAGDDVVADPDGVVGARYGLSPEGLALVRPDGYLGLVADTADADLLRRYLSDTLGVAERAAV